MNTELQPKRGSLWTYVLLLIAAIGAMLFIGKCSTKPQSPFAKEYAKAQGDTLDIGIELNPAIYYLQGDSIVGRDYEILLAISTQHDIPMRFHPFVPISHAMDYLEKGLYDIVVASMPMTADLKKQFIMTDPVYLDREVLVQRRDSTGKGKISSQLQLGGDTVWISNLGTRKRLENLSMEIGDSIHIKADESYSAEHLFMLVASGVIKNAVVNERIALSLANDYPDVDISTPISFNQFQSWALNSKHRELADSLNAWIAELHADDE